MRKQKKIRWQKMSDKILALDSNSRQITARLTFCPSADREEKKGAIMEAQLRFPSPQIPRYNIKETFNGFLGSLIGTP